VNCANVELAVALPVPVATCGVALVSIRIPAELDDLTAVVAVVFVRETGTVTGCEEAIAEEDGAKVEEELEQGTVVVRRVLTVVVAFAESG
jgi:hypothetical protein